MLEGHVQHVGMVAEKMSQELAFLHLSEEIFTQERRNVPSRSRPACEEIADKAEHGGNDPRTGEDLKMLRGLRAQNERDGSAATLSYDRSDGPLSMMGLMESIMLLACHKVSFAATCYTLVYPFLMEHATLDGFC